MPKMLDRFGLYMYYMGMNDPAFPELTFEEKFLQLMLFGGKWVAMQLDEALVDLDLSHTKMWALKYIVESDQPMALSDLAECTNSGRSNVTQLMDRLEAEQLARRVPDPEDRRRVLIEATSEGKQRYHAGIERSRQVASALMEPLNAEERRQLVEYLERVARGVSRES